MGAKISDSMKFGKISVDTPVFSRYTKHMNYPFYFSGPFSKNVKIESEQEAAKYFPWVLSLNRYLEIQRENGRQLSYVADFDIREAGNKASEIYDFIEEREKWSELRDSIVNKMFESNLTRGWENVPNWAREQMEKHIC